MTASVNIYDCFVRGDILNYDLFFMCHIYCHNFYFVCQNLSFSKESERNQPGPHRNFGAQF